MAQVLVTGGCGFVGRHLANELANSGEDVTVLDVTDEPRGLDETIRYVQGDVRDEDAVAKAVVGGLDVVYHLSAMVGVDNYLSVPADVIDVNLLGTRNLLRQAHRADAKVVIASTSEVYGRNPATPWREDSDRVLGSTSVDRWCYSSSKALAEHLTFAHIRQYGLRATIVRYFNVYGPWQRPAYVVSRSIHRALNGLAPEVYDGGAQTRCFTYVDDAVRATLVAGRSADADGECFNIGSTTETTVGEVTGIIAELTGAPGHLVPFDAPGTFGPSYQDIPRRVPDTGKALSMLGVECSTPLRAGLSQTVEWARHNRWWLEQLIRE